MATASLVAITARRMKPSIAAHQALPAVGLHGLALAAYPPRRCAAIVIAVISGKGKEKDMPFAKNQDIKIYYEVEGQGPPIILAHGVTGNTTFWTGYGYVDQLKDKFTVIIFDARGHGQSDKPHDVESYDSQLMVGDVMAIMDALGIAETH